MTDDAETAEGDDRAPRAERALAGILQLEEPLSQLEHLSAALNDLALAMLDAGHDGASPKTLYLFAERARLIHQDFDRHFRELHALSRGEM